MTLYPLYPCPLSSPVSTPHVCATNYFRPQGQQDYSVRHSLTGSANARALQMNVIPRPLNSQPLYPFLHKWTLTLILRPCCGSCECCCNKLGRVDRVDVLQHANLIFVGSTLRIMWWLYFYIGFYVIFMYVPYSFLY